MLIIHNRTALTLRSLAALTTKRAYCKDYASSSDDEKDTKKAQRKERKAAKTVDKTAATATADAPVESAAARLNKLLVSMQTDDNTLSAMQQQQQQNMARPGDGSKKRREAAKEQMAAKDIFAAAKRVASLLGADNQKQAESELLSKLLGHDQTEAVDKTTANDESKTPASDLSLSELIVGMKIDRSQQPAQQTRGDYVRRTMAAKRTQQQQQRQPLDRSARGVGSKREAETYTGSVNLFGCEPLGIFKDVNNLRDSPDMLSTWSHLQKHELQLQVTHPPANYFEKIAQWTEQGKVWRFPIDNEQGLTEELHVDFSEHIFLEQHLDPWCPTKGPIRHFMELVCVGLSKNPYITAREKKEHILWYRDYFETKKDILRDLMSQEKMEQAAKNAKQIQET